MSVKMIRRVIGKLDINKRDSQIAGFLFALPFVIGFAFIFVNVIIFSVKFVLSEYKMSEKGFKFSFNHFYNFYYALRINPDFIKELAGALQSMVTSIPLILIMSLFVAVVLNNKVPCKGFFRAVFFLPVIVSTGLISRMDVSNQVMSGMAVSISDSVQDSAIAAFGDISNLLQSLNFSPALIDAVSGATSNITSVFSLCGVQILIFLAGIQSIPASVYEAADVEGAPEWVKFWKITLPMVSPMILVNVIYAAIDFLTRDNSSLAIFIHRIAFGGAGAHNYAAAMAWIFTICATTVLLVFVKITNKLIKSFGNEV